MSLPLTYIKPMVLDFRNVGLCFETCQKHREHEWNKRSKKRGCTCMRIVSVFDFCLHLCMLHLTVAHKCQGNKEKLTAKKKSSREKKKSSRKKRKAHGKREKLTAKRKAHGEKEKLTAKEKSSRQKRKARGGSKNSWRGSLAVTRLWCVACCF